MHPSQKMQWVLSFLQFSSAMRERKKLRDHTHLEPCHLGQGLVSVFSHNCHSLSCNRKHGDLSYDSQGSTPREWEQQRYLRVWAVSRLWWLRWKDNISLPSLCPNIKSTFWKIQWQSVPILAFCYRYHSTWVEPLMEFKSIYTFSQWQNY